MFFPNGKKQQGLSAIEFVISLPLIFILLAAVLELGFYLVQYNTLNKLVENAARYAVVKAVGTALIADMNEIQCVALTGSAELTNKNECQNAARLPGLTKSDIAITPPEINGTDYVIITANYNFSPLGPIVGTGVLDSGYVFKIHSSVTMRVKP